MKGANNMYTFLFQYDGDPDSITVLPLAPSSFETSLKSNSKSIDLISIGEATIIKDAPLREFSFKILLPRYDTIADIKEKSGYFHEPIFYLNKFRSFKTNKKPIRFIINRVLPDNTTLFPGNLLVTMENYTVKENGGEEGDFWVDIKLKEYRDIKVIITKATGEMTEDGKQVAVQEPQRPAKEPEKLYATKGGETLLDIAKTQLNDESKYKEIIKWNKLEGTEPIAELAAGCVLKLSE